MSRGVGACQQYKINWSPSHPSYMPIPPASTTRPFAHCSMDLIMDLPLSDGFNLLRREGLFLEFQDQVFFQHSLDGAPHFVYCSESWIWGFFFFISKLNLAYHSLVERVELSWEVFGFIDCSCFDHEHSPNMSVPLPTWDVIKYAVLRGLIWHVAVFGKPFYLLEEVNVYILMEETQVDH